MRIFGIGTDIVKISRIKKSIKKKFFYQKYLVKEKFLDVEKLKIPLIVLLRDLLQKRRFQKL